MWQGKEVIEELAKIYPELYLTPGEEGEGQYREVVGLGKEPESKSLDLFIRDDKDRAYQLDTPAGKVLVVVLFHREDFELFCCLVGHGARDEEIPPTQGAVTYDGVINWTKIRAHEKAFREEEKRKGNLNPDWTAEFNAFVSKRENYRDTFILLSWGPYSAVTAEKAGEREEEWLEKSYVIRLYHEATHFVCRKLFPEKISAIWDELVADAIGIYAAYQELRVDLEETFLGIGPEGYVGGRLENYVEKGEEGRERLEILAKRIPDTLELFLDTVNANKGIPPLEMTLLLEGLYENWRD